MTTEESSIGDKKEERKSWCPLQSPMSPSHLKSPPTSTMFALSRPLGPEKRRAWSKHLSSWFWEICSSAVSIISIVLLLVFLSFFSEVPVEKSVSQTSPSTIISVITTIARTSMMVSVASCISQLKWKHYLDRPNKLHHLQIFEDASRGPWGAARALLAVPRRASLILLLALITIVSLAVEPMAQKILGTGKCSAHVQHNAGTIAVAQDYDSLSTNLDGTLTSHALVVRTALMKAMVGDVIQPQSNCWNSTTSCTWSNLTSLGVCHETRNLTSQIRPKKQTEGFPTNATAKPANQTRYTYTIPKLTAPDSHVNVKKRSNVTDLAIDLVFPRGEIETDLGPSGASVLRKTLFNSTAKMELPDETSDGYNEGVSYAFLRLPRDNQILEEDGYEPEPEIFVTRWYYCAQTFYDVAWRSSGSIGSRNMITQPLYYVRSSYNSSTIKKGFSMYGDNTGNQYNITFGFVGSMWHTLADLLNSNVLQLSIDGAGKTITKGGTDEDPDFGQFLYDTWPPSGVIQNIATAATNLIRNLGDSSDNDKGFSVNGDLVYQGICYSVGWPWVLVPVLEVTATAVLLGIAIWRTRDQPLLKGSVVAYLLHGLEGWTDKELGALLPSEESLTSLDDVSKDMYASLTRDKNGRWRFRKADERRWRISVNF